MKIGIIGVGNIGATIGTLWVNAGHDVVFGVRHPDRAATLLARLNDRAASGTNEEAVDFGEVVFTAAPFGVWPVLAAQIAEAVAGKVVIDAANPYPGRDGDFAQHAIDAGEGAGVPVARLLPGARLVRGFNSVAARTFKEEAHRAGDRIGVPLAGDDIVAVEIAARLVRDAGFDPVSVGKLVEARHFDPDTPVYGSNMTGPQLRAALGV
jgi:predicted dinucleotide-binding enzyme